METGMTSSEHACPTCGSKRTTQIVAAERGTSSLWCHSCGTVSERERGREAASAAAPNA